MTDFFYNTLEFLMERILLPIFVIGIIILLIGLPVGCYFDSKRETFSLKKDEWLCTQSQLRNTTTLMPMGGVLMPMTTSHTECIQWSQH